MSDSNSPPAVHRPGDGTVPSDDVARLLVHCPDRPGIVSAVSSFLTNAGANIVSLGQHSSEPQEGMFFQRTVFHLPGLMARRAELERAFAAEVAGPMDMELDLH